MGHRKPNNQKYTSTVSILTVSQLSRIQTLKLTADYINNQTYDIIEWVIVNGSKNDNDAQLFKAFVNIELSTMSKVKISYVDYDANVKLGGFRNLANDNAKGDILIWMDDDDFYFNDYVRYVVKKLSKSKKLIAGQPVLYFYDFNMDRMFMSDTIKNHGKNSVSNSCLAYKREYLKNHRYDDQKQTMEEMEFTNNFTEEIEILDPNMTTILSSHNLNTFNKKEFIYHGLIFSGNVIESDLKYPNNEKYKIYKSLFSKPEQSEYDIIYLCCPYSAPWHPTDKNLGGSEQAVVELSREFAKLHNIAVYMDINEDITVDGVEYKDWRNFKFDNIYKKVIVWRPIGMIFLKYFDIKADEIILDLHDSNSRTFKIYYRDIYDKYYFKSLYHRSQYKDIVPNDEQCVIIPNGVRVETFKNVHSDDEISTRNKFRFCYTSCYSRGLEYIVPYIWSRIFEKEPRAELHVYYGMSLLNDEKLKTKLTFMLAQPGVMDHGKQSIEMIAREKQLSSYHLYISQTATETDCIAVKESLCAGCIPLLSTDGVFPERDGVHYDINDIDEERLNDIVDDILDLMRNEQRRIELQTKFRNSNDIKSWKEIANEWFV